MLALVFGRWNLGCLSRQPGQNSSVPRMGGGGGLERDREGVSSSPRPTSRDDRDEDAQHLFPPREGVHLSSLSAGVSLGSLVPFSAFLTPESVSANQSSEFDLWSQ